ncbi:hypothetical protein P692DRAFT_20717793 [Suillus brevipes Sb2]|nr:hypothetical protein P692DRAFT_20717793 [Suillus brevipes Sb2]
MRVSPRVATGEFRFARCRKVRSEKGWIQVHCDFVVPAKGRNRQLWQPRKSAMQRDISCLLEEGLRIPKGGLIDAEIVVYHVRIRLASIWGGRQSSSSGGEVDTRDTRADQSNGLMIDVYCELKREDVKEEENSPAHMSTQNMSVRRKQTNHCEFQRLE